MLTISLHASFDISGTQVNKLLIQQTIDICAYSLYRNHLFPYPCIAKAVFMELMEFANVPAEFSFNDISHV